MSTKLTQQRIKIGTEELKVHWALGDWDSIVERCETDVDSLDHEQTSYLICALFQQGNVSAAKNLVAKTGKVDKQHLLSKLLVSGVYNSLGKAALCNRQQAKADIFFNAALIVGFSFNNTVALTQSRTALQYAQLAIPYICPPLGEQQTLGDVQNLLHDATSWFPTEPALQLALADDYQRTQNFDKAIVHWQQVVGALGKDAPQAYYDRLKDAYKQVKSFPLGTVEQETLTGSIDKHKLLATIHSKLEPSFYFEIGVQTGKSLALAKCESVGIDPMPLLSATLNVNHKIVTSSSDTFFAEKGDMLYSKSLDLVFIDGMHLFEYALRDFINVERYSSPATLVVIDDIYPGHKDQANRDRITRAWTGDVWKLKVVLQQYRPDLILLSVDAYPTGLLLISGLNPNNTALSDQYDSIVAKFVNYPMNSDEVIGRVGAVPGSAEAINDLIELVKTGRKQKFDGHTLKTKWSEFINSPVN